MGLAQAAFGNWEQLGATMATSGQEAMSPEESWDAVEMYFECITTCSLEDGECVTRCVEALREGG
ncbi:MAG: hypothetical protein ACK55E_13850 [Cyanobacteriota bacterium]|jgi:hypothetical protein